MEKWKVFIHKTAIFIVKQGSREDCFFLFQTHQSEINVQLQGSDVVHAIFFVQAQPTFLGATGFPPATQLSL